MSRFFRNIMDWYVSGFMELGRAMESGVKMF